MADRICTPNVCRQSMGLWGIVVKEWHGDLPDKKDADRKSTALSATMMSNEGLSPLHLSRFGYAMETELLAIVKRLERKK
jgi:hypothetical protein